jgi:hypothetical protein
MYKNIKKNAVRVLVEWSWGRGAVLGPLLSSA